MTTLINGFQSRFTRLLLGLLLTLVANLASAKVLYVHTDHLGTPRLMTNEQGTTVWRNLPTGEPFGNSPVEEDPDGDSTNTTLNLRFPGQYYDKETNLNYNYFRDYDPSTGRFPQADPIGLAGGSMSLYTYADNAPMMKTDPLGLATYMCTQPLHALGDNWGPRLYPESRWNPSPFYHQYACVSDGKSSFKCGGQDRQGGPWSPGKPSDDQYKPDQCKQEEPDNTCIEQCLLKKFAGPRPGYGLFGPGTNCQEWAEDAVSDCRKQCKKK